MDWSHKINNTNNNETWNAKNIPRRRQYHEIEQPKKMDQYNSDKLKRKEAERDKEREEKGGERERETTK